MHQVYKLTPNSNKTFTSLFITNLSHDLNKTWTKLEQNLNKTWTKLEQDLCDTWTYDLVEDLSLICWKIYWRFVSWPCVRCCVRPWSVTLREMLRETLTHDLAWDLDPWPVRCCVRPWPMTLREFLPGPCEDAVCDAGGPEWFPENNFYFLGIIFYV